MLETYSLLLTDSLRSFQKNLFRSPVLYLLFFSMTLFSVFMIVGISIVFIRFDISIAVRDLFFLIFGLFILKAAYDFYHVFITKKEAVYALSTPVKQSRTVFEMALFIFWTNVGFWAVLSGLYTGIIANLNVSFDGAEAYLLITAGVMLAILVGIALCFILFSKYRITVTLLGVPLILLWYQFNWTFVFLSFMIYLMVLLILFRNVLIAFLFQYQKNRSHERERVYFPGSILSICVKECLFLWRERLLLSIIFSASFLGFTSGYLAVFGESLFLPEQIRFFAMRLSIETYAFVGIYVLVVYTSVFISLNLFLEEERTIWLLKSLPISTQVFVTGKTLSMILPFFASIPFLAFFLAFTQGEAFEVVLWLFIFSFLSGMSIAIPLGSRYVGGKSDVLLLYSVSLIMLVVLGIGFLLIEFAQMYDDFSIVFLLLLLIIQFFILIGSVKVSSRFLKNAPAT